MLTETFSSRTLEKMKSIDQYRWRPTSDGTGRGGEAEIQSDFWPNLIFSGTNIELWRLAVLILNFRSNGNVYFSQISGLG